MKASPRGFVDFARFAVDHAVIEETVALLREAGSKGDERMVVWGAIALDERTLSCVTTYVPAQTAIRTVDGVGIVVSTEALRELNLELSRRGEALAAQLHAHPADAYHSNTDDALALATTRGALSVVLPDFAAGGMSNMKTWAAYRLLDRGWERIELESILIVR